MGELSIRVTVAAEDAERRLSSLADVVRGVAKSTQGAVSGDMAQAYQALSRQIAQTEREMSAAKGGAAQYRAWRDAKKAFDDARRSGQSTQKQVEAMDRAAASLGKKVDGSTGSVKAADKVFAQYAGTLRSQQASLVGQIAGLESELGALAQSSTITGSASIDPSPAQAAIADLKAQLAELIALMGAAGVSSGTGGAGKTTGRSGGGGGKNAEEEAAREAERLRKEAIQRDYDYIEHLKAMNQLSLEQEIEMLTRMYSAHALNAEEIMELDEKVYDARQRLRERDADSMDSLYDGLQTALENRYQSMLDAETGQLDQSRKAWEQWSEDSVKAIQAQIDALDALSDAEDREEKDAQELRKIEKLKQEYQFEQDAYSRAKIAQQIEQAEQSRQERLRKLDISDQKAALQKQQDAIRERADSETEKLDEQQEAVEKAYAERMKAQSLAAEAEKLLMSTNQQEILGLIGSYAPEYDALGKTLGERLLDGFTGAVGNVKSWFEGMNAQIDAMQENLKSEALSGLDGFYRQAEERKETGETKVELTVNFNEPVESESQVTRRIEQTLERAGSMLTGGY